MTLIVIVIAACILWVATIYIVCHFRERRLYREARKMAELDAAILALMQQADRRATQMQMAAGFMKGYAETMTKQREDDRERKGQRQGEAT